MRRTREQTVLIIVFLGPAFLLYTAFVAVPGLRALLFSLQRWNGLSEPRWTGFDNFIALARDGGIFLAALRHNLFLSLVGGSLILALSLFFASVLHRRVRGAALFRITFFFPNVIASVAIALLWTLLYSTSDFGVINGFLAFLHERTGWAPVELPFPFTGKRYLIYAIVPLMVWAWTGFYMVLFLAGMEGIPEEYYEAAEMDGATGFGQFWHVTLPLLREVLVVGMVFLVINCLKIFEFVWIMDNEWPTAETHVLGTLLYQKVFSEYNVGYGSAVAVVLFVLVFLATLVTLRLSRKEALEY